MTVLGPQTQIAGRYQLLEPIGSGALGEVWRAHDDQLTRPVAVKLVHAELGANPGFLEAFGDEARKWAAVSDPGTVWVYDFGAQTGTAPADPPVAYLVMELVDGRPLDTVLAEGPMSTVGTLDLVAQVASTLHAAHQRALVHGNVKPSNFLVRSDGVVKVTDFGIARAFGAVPLSHAREDLANACYRSPEQLAGEEATVASDLYSIGIVAYACLSGELPFASEGPMAAAVEHLTERPRPLPDHVPAPVRELVRRLLSKNPAARPVHAGALAREAVAVCRQLGGCTTRPVRELLGGEAARLL
jgi:serine/threonine-protein kinase